MKNLEEIISLLKTKRQVNKSDYFANTAKILEFENVLKIPLPQDFKIFYQNFNGFDFNDEFMLRIVPIKELEITENNNTNVEITFAEFMIYSDIWILKYTNSSYRISHLSGVELTNNLSEFIERCMKGGVLNPGGLYEWEKEKTK